MNRRTDQHISRAVALGVARLVAAMVGLLAVLATGAGLAAEIATSPGDATRDEPAETAVVPPIGGAGWRVAADEHRIEEHLGRRSLMLRGGSAWLPTVALEDGVVEVDMAFGPDRTFAGVLWRIEGRGDAENFYLRPHQSGNPDANQYTPVFGGLTSWQLYHGPAYSAATRYPFDQWFRLKVVFEGGRAAVYLHGADEPELVVPELKRTPAEGAVGVSNGPQAPVWFSGFTARPLRPGEGVPAGGAELPPPAPGVIERYEVSTPFDGARLDGLADLPTALADELRFSTLAAESTGIANLARVADRRRDADTVLVRFPVPCRSPGPVRLRFGYSDTARLYVNGRLVYAGDRSYRSRDYRDLGTIGLFDGIVVDCGAGPREITLAVSEGFGGWGVTAAVEPMVSDER